MSIPLTAREPVDFRPPALQPTKHPESGNILHPGHPDVVIKVRVPTFIERDSYSSALIRAGVVSYTPSQIRDITLGGVEDLYPQDEQEEVRQLLEELWQVMDARRACEVEQQKKLIELHEKAEAAKKKLDPKKATAELDKIKPTQVMDRQRFVRANGVAQQLMARFEPLREAMAQLTDQDAKRSWLNAEVYVVGWEGLPNEPEGNGRGGLTKEEVVYLRSKIGKEAFEELSDFITSLQGLDEDEEKNLALLLESMSAPPGLTPLASSASSKDGNLTAEPSMSTPDENT